MKRSFKLNHPIRSVQLIRELARGNRAGPSIFDLENVQGCGKLLLTKIVNINAENWLLRIKCENAIKGFPYCSWTWMICQQNCSRITQLCSNAHLTTRDSLQGNHIKI